MWGRQAAFRVILVGGADGAMAEAVTLAGGEIAAELAWGEPLITDTGAILVLDAAGEDWDGVPDQIRSWAEHADVVSCTFPQLDAVASALLFSDPRILCEPDMAERVTALLVAARGSATVAPRLGEEESDRLARVADELVRVTELLSQLVRQEGARSGKLGERPLGYGPPPAEGDAALVDATEIRRVIRARRIRERAFGERLFEDPAWDILLDLFAAWLERAEVSVSSLCIAAAVAPTTALRWIGRMTASGLLVRERDPFDGRRALISLSDTALAGMRSYVAMLRAQGLPFV